MELGKQQEEDFNNIKESKPKNIVLHTTQETERTLLQPMQLKPDLA